jgi:hypothetical protein
MLLAKFYRKSGDIMNWSKTMLAMKENHLDFIKNPMVPIEVAAE